MDYRKQLLTCRPEQRDEVKGKIEAQEDFKSCVDQVREDEERINKLKAFFQREKSKEILMDVILDTNDERLENKLIARIKHFEKLKRDFFKDPHKTLKSL